MTVRLGPALVVDAVEPRDVEALQADPGVLADPQGNEFSVTKRSGSARRLFRL